MVCYDQLRGHRSLGQVVRSQQTSSYALSMLEPENCGDNSPAPSSNISSLDIEDYEPLSPAEYTISRQDTTFIIDPRPAADITQEAARGMDDIDTGADAQQQPEAVASDQPAQNSQAGDSDAAASPTAAVDDDSERRESGAAAGPSQDSPVQIQDSPVELVSDSEDDHMPLGALMSRGSVDLQESDVVQRPEGLAPIRVNGAPRPMSAAEKLRLTMIDSPTPAPPTPGAGVDTAADGAAASAGNGVADRPAQPAAAAEKPPSPASTAVDTQDGSSSEEEEEDDSAPQSGAQSARQGSNQRRKRRNLLPVVRKAARCGKCHTCLHPKMKKACITVREQMINEMGEKGELPVSLLPKLSQKGSNILPASAPSRPAAQDFSALDKEEEKKKLDPFQETLKQIIGRSGGVVHAKHLDRLLRLLDDSNNTHKRLVMLTVVEGSSSEVKAAFVHSRGLNKLLSWLEAADGGVPNSIALAKKVLVTLRKLPVDVEALQGSNGGRRMKKMSRTGPESLRQGAAQVLEFWVKLVEATQAAGGPSKRPAPAESNGVAPKKPKTEASSSQATNGKPGTPRAGAQPKQADTGKTSQAKAAAPKAGAASAAAAQKQESVPHLAVLAAADLDEPVKAEPAPKPKPKPTVRDALYNPKKVHQLKVLDDEAAQKLATDRAEAAAQKAPAADDAAASTSTAGANGSAAASSFSTAAIGGASPSSSLLGLPAPANKFGATTRITAFTPKFGSLGAPSTGLGGPRPPPPLTSAATRAAEAAARVPSPDRESRAPKRKKVSWVAEQQLVSVRWFRKEDPASTVRSESALREEVTEPPSEAAEQAVSHPPGFELAARAEHQNEAAAIRLMADSAEIDEEEVEVPEMELHLNWHAPPFCRVPPEANSAPTPEPSCGEESREKERLRVRYGYIEPVHYGPGGRHPPDSPEEPPNEAPSLVQEKRMPLQSMAPPDQAPQLAAPVTSPPMQHQQPYYQQPPPQQMTQQQMTQQVAPHQPAYQPPFSQLPPAPQHHMHQHQTHMHAPVDYVEQQLQQLQQLQPPQQQGFPQQQQQQRGILGHPPVATAGGPQSLQPLHAENVMEEARPGGPAGRGARGGRGVPEREDRRPDRPWQPRPCAFYNLHLGCFRGDQCRFAHVASDERPEDIERRAQSVSSAPLQLMRNLAPGEHMHIRGPSIYNPDAPVEGRGPMRGAGGSSGDSRKRGRDRPGPWERNPQPRRERDRQFDN